MLKLTIYRRSKNNLDYCISHLKDARDAAKLAKCPRLVKKIRSAIASAGGAARHLQRQKNEGGA
jgi:hypothetical protein